MKKKKKNRKDGEIKKQEKDKLKELKRNKLDKLSFGIIIAIMVLLPIWQIIRMILNNQGKYNWYSYLNPSYILIIGSIFLLIIYIINIIKKRIKITISDIIIYIFILFGIVSTILSTNHTLAILGNNNRYEGILTLSSYFIIILTVKNIKLKTRHFQILNTFIILGGIQSLFAIFQCFISSFPLKFSYEYMASALCVNPIYLGSYMMLLSIISIGIYLFSNNKKYLFSAILFIFTIVLSQSTIALISLFLGLMFLLIYIIINHKEKVKKTIIIFILSIITATISILGTSYIYEKYYDIDINKTYTIKNDFKKLNDKLLGIRNDSKEELEYKDNYISEQSFLENRLFIINISTQIIKENFWFGTGPDNFAISFQEHSPLYVDRAYNIYMHIFATLGVFGFISYIALLINTLANGIFSTNKITIICLTAFIAYVIQGLFGINTIEVTTYFYILIGIILASYNNNDHDKIYN